MKFETTIKILFYLLARGKTSAKTLASRFSISTRSVVRYVDTLSLAGIPVIADTGRNGGYYIAESYKITDGFMTKEEFDAVLSAVHACNERLSDKHLTSAADKLKSVYRPNSDYTDLKAGNFWIDFTNWNGSDNAKEMISIFERAIEKERIVKIKYVDRNGNKSVRSIEPHVIVMKQGQWYVYAFCRTREEFRTFKISRISYADVTDNPFKKREVDLSLLSAQNFENQENEYVDFSIDETAVADVEEWLGVENVYQKTDGTYAASCKLPLDEWLISKIMGYGDKILVTSPDALKKEISKRAKKLYERYL